MADGCPIPIFAIDMQRRLFLWNRAMELVTGHGRNEVLGRPVDSGMFYDGASRPVLAELVLEMDLSTMAELYGAKRLSASDSIPEAFEAIDTLTFGGSTRTLYFQAARLRDADGRLVGAVETLQNITARAEAERTLLAQREMLRSLGAELIQAEQRMRRRIAHDLHDHVSQDLAAAKIAAGNLRDSVRPEAVGQLDRLVELLDRAIEETSTLTFELSPPILDQRGLVDALEWLAEQFQQRHGLAISYEPQALDGLVALDLRVLLFRATGELLNNVAKHAHATRVRLRVFPAGDQVCVEVADNGQGMAQPWPGQAGRRQGGFGLLSIQERLRPIGGRCEMSSIPGKGTTALLSAPMRTDEKERTDVHPRIAG